MRLTPAFPSRSRLLRLPLLFLLLLCCRHSFAQFYSVQTNLAGWATGTFNGELSCAVSPRWSLHAPVSYNPWTLSGNQKFKHVAFLPGVRYWRDQSYGYGWFFGGHAIVSRFNVGGLLGSSHRYEGNAYGAGLSAGFSLPLRRSWNVEFEAGGGGAYVKRDRYACERCGEKVSQDRGFRLVPSKLSVSVVYLF